MPHPSAMCMFIMGGTKCLQALRQIDLQVKIIVASGYAPHHCAQDLLALGADAFIAKPFELEALLAAVRTAIDQTTSRGGSDSPRQGAKARMSVHRHG